MIAVIADYTSCASLLLAAGASMYDNISGRSLLDSVSEAEGIICRGERKKSDMLELLQFFEEKRKRGKCSWLMIADLKKRKFKNNSSTHQPCLT